MPTRANIAVKIFGDELPVLRELATQVNEVIKDVPGVVDLSVEQQTEIPTRRVKVDQAAARYGVRAGDVATATQTAFIGSDLGKWLKEQISFPLVVGVQGENPSRLAEIAQIQIDTPSVVKVPLSALAEICEDRGPNFIMREGVQRRIVVQCNTVGHQFDQELIAHPVPNDLEAVKVLAASAAVLELFMWLSYRCFTAKSTESIPLFGDFGLANQIGTATTRGLRRFRAMVEQWPDIIRALWTVVASVDQRFDLSADGKRLAIATREGIQIRTADGAEAKQIVMISAGDRVVGATWSASGKTAYFVRAKSIDLFEVSEEARRRLGSQR